MTLRIGDRRRLLSALALVVAGALLGAGIVAWRTDTLPFLGSKLCWNSMAGDDIDALFGVLHTEDAAIPPVWARPGRPEGRCRIALSGESSRGRMVDIRVHRLSGLEQDNVSWAWEFLSARMSPLDGELLGMASDTRAWVALPGACTGGPARSDGPSVVDVAYGNSEFRRSADAAARVRDQRALARVAVDVANGTMNELGCEGDVGDVKEPTGDPGMLLPLPANGEMCARSLVKLPKSYVGSGARMRLSSGFPDTGPVHGCEIVGGEDGRPAVRLNTVQEPALSRMFATSLQSLGHDIRVDDPSVKVTGSYSSTAAALRITCPSKSKADAVLLAEDQRDLGGHEFIRETFPSYVTSEAMRLGCGPVEIRMSK